MVWTPFLLKKKIWINYPFWLTGLKSFTLYIFLWNRKVYVFICYKDPTMLTLYIWRWQYWTTFLYVIACVQSYGENCQHPCSQHCYNKECDRFNGTCLTGCTHGFHRQKCNKGTYVKCQTNLYVAWKIIYCMSKL